MKDRHGNDVAIGGIVRVLEIDQGLLDWLPLDELPHTLAMLNSEYPIEDFPEDGKASVTNWWEEGPGQWACSCLYLLAHEFELMEQARSSN
ncbi:hypothetical protein LXA47_13755 [Massilia sp. P8910]|uniref:hypothetical protein n=1 Tax=Massilia antarctica TaxID=2765360 RepID=UPI001E5CFC40|nr:hypothetical protein [Massilia antarctica]MCE3604666.1 hypothetical protein [Massilia antarctica]